MINKDNLHQWVETDVAIPINEDVLIIKKAIEAAGFEAFLVGGAVRDILMGTYPLDWDMATSALPDDICEILKGFTLSYSGISHGTVRVYAKSTTVEITTYREEGPYKDGRHPDEVVFIRDAEKDMLRRDFTVNAMAMDIRGNKVYIYDPFGGCNDIRNKMLRSVGCACRKFDEDGLRAWRALRFESVQGFEPDEEIKVALKDNKKFSDVASGRIKDELHKLLMGKYAEKAVKTGVEIIQLWIRKMILTSCEGNKEYKSYIRACENHDMNSKETADVKLSSAFKSAPFDRNLRWAILIYCVLKDICSEEKIIDEDAFVREKLNIFFLKVPFTKKDKKLISAYVMFYVKIDALGVMDFSKMPVIDRAQLNIDYYDLKEAGVEDSNIGAAFKYLIDVLNEGKIKNKRHELIKAVRNMGKCN